MELLKATQQITEVYEALNLIYNGDIKEDYVGAAKLLENNPLTNELVPTQVLKFILDCATLQADIQGKLGCGQNVPTPTDEDGKISYRLEYGPDDVTPREYADGAIYPDQTVYPTRIRGTRANTSRFAEEY